MEEEELRLPLGPLLPLLSLSTAPTVLVETARELWLRAGEPVVKC